MKDPFYCPRCGKPFGGGTSYCRTCGLALDAVSEIVSGESDTAPERSKRPNFNFIRFGIGLFIFGTVLGLVNTVLRDLALFPETYGKAIFITFVAAGLLSIGSAFIFPSTKYTKRKKQDSSSGAAEAGQMEAAPSTGQLGPAQFDEVEFSKDVREPVAVEPSSVTEHTTRHLK